MKLTIEIVSVVDRDELVAEIWQKDEMVAEVRQVEDGGFLLEIYSPPNRGSWSFDLDMWMTALSEAKKRLG